MPARAQPVSAPAPPGPAATRLLRLPVALYALRAGWLLGHRFLLLTHRGRRTGRLRRSVLEVVNWHPETREAVVCSGFGPHAHWYRNLVGGGAVEVQIARLRFEPAVRPLTGEEASDALVQYERRHRGLAPAVRAVLSRLAGFRYDGSRAARTRLVQTLPFVAFRPRD